MTTQKNKVSSLNLWVSLTGLHHLNTTKTSGKLQNQSTDVEPGWRSVYTAAAPANFHAAWSQQCIVSQCGYQGHTMSSLPLESMETSQEEKSPAQNWVRLYLQDIESQILQVALRNQCSCPVMVWSPLQLGFQCAGAQAISVALSAPVFPIAGKQAGLQKPFMFSVMVKLPFHPCHRDLGGKRRCKSWGGFVQTELDQFAPSSLQALDPYVS